MSDEDKMDKIMDELHDEELVLTSLVHAPDEIRKKCLELREVANTIDELMSRAVFGDRHVASLCPSKEGGLFQCSCCGQDYPTDEIGNVYVNGVIGPDYCFSCGAKFVYDDEFTVWDGDEFRERREESGRNREVARHE